MNLIDANWIPVRRNNGLQDWISPLQIGDPDIVALDAARADFNGALAQFLIGLLQTTTPVDSQSEWEGWLESPPDEKILAGWFGPVFDAFNLGGDGPRFMQDLTLTSEMAEAKPLSALLIEAPGENALKLNTDHFIKRDLVNGLCLDCVACALFVLQSSAPAGGAGHRTSLRGGGPLTTLVIDNVENSRTLWRDLWLNIREKSRFLSQGGDASKSAPMFSFPWLSEITSLQEEKGEFHPQQGHPAHVFWAMPRRIRLMLNDCAGGNCDICGRASAKVVSQYLTKNYGLNYKGAWNHPLSPYYESKPDEWLPLHPQPGGYGYKHWLPWVFGGSSNGESQRAASVVTDFLTYRHRKGQFRLWAFGYDMDKMKARCWYEATLPLYGIAEHDKRSQSIIQAVIAQWIESATLVALYLRDTVKTAWFSPHAEMRGDLSYIDAAFYSCTEPEFYRLLRSLLDELRNAEDDPVLSGLREQWRKQLVDVAMHIFDEKIVGSSPIERQNPKRIAEAHKALIGKLYGDKLKQSVGLSVTNAEKSKKSAKSSRKPKEA